MRILITNDDGVWAPGILALAEVATQFGEVVVVAPDRERSACSHSMTLHDPLRISEVELPVDCKAYQVNGVPVDCVNIGLTEFYPDGCDLILSGFNAGPNMGFDITYSGTVAGAMEGSINGIHSIALSMAIFVNGAPSYFDTGKQWLMENWHDITSLDLGKLCFLNVNIPALPAIKLRGTRACQMGKRVYQDRVEKRTDPWGRPYYWQGGVVVMDSTVTGTDVWAVSEHFVSMTPVHLDWTQNAMLDKLRERWG